VLGADIAIADCVCPNADIKRARRSIDVDRRLRRSGDRKVTGPAENGFDVRDSAANVNSVEYSRRGWHGDRRQHADDAQRDNDFGECERVSRVRLTSLGLAS